MVDNVKENDPLAKLLQRIVDDDGVEGNVALNLFRQRFKERKIRQVYFLENRTPDALIEIIDEHETTIRDLRASLAAKTEEVATLHKRAEKTEELVRELSELWTTHAGSGRSKRT